MSARFGASVVVATILIGCHADNRAEVPRAYRCDPSGSPDQCPLPWRCSATGRCVDPGDQGLVPTPQVTLTAGPAPTSSPADRVAGYIFTSYSLPAAITQLRGRTLTETLYADPPG